MRKNRNKITTLPKINNSKHSSTMNTRNTLIAGVIAGLLFVWVIFNILFPTFVIKSSSKENYLVHNLEGKKYLELKTRGGYPFHKIEMDAEVSIKKQTKKIFGKVYQDELGLYPENEVIYNQKQLDKIINIPNNQDIKNGELISRGNSVYLITNNQYRAFSNAETFDTLGFDWGKVKEDAGYLSEGLEKGDNITKVFSYLPSSFVMVGENIYLLGDKTKYPIDNSNKKLVNFIKNKFSVISVSKDKLRSVGEIICEKKRNVGKIKVTCEFQDKQKIVQPRAKVIIEIKNDSIIIKKNSVRITTFDGLHGAIPMITLRNIRKGLILRYGGRLGIIK